MSADYAHALGARLRSIRAQQGLSLHGVEEKSEGRWKAVVVGSYERGDRAVTVAKLAELAEFYGVPVAELLPDARATRRGSPSPKLVIDLHEDPAKIKDMTTTPGGTTIEAIYQIEQSQIRPAMIRAIEEATKKSQAIREKLNLA